MINAGLDVNARRAKNGRTLLWSAVAAYNVEAVEILLKAGADVEIGTKDGVTPLMASANYTGRKNIEVLETIQLLLDAGADPNRRGKYGYTALHHATRSEHPVASSVIALLLDHGADPNVHTTTAFGRTPLMIAARVGPNASTVQVLLRGGADVNARDNMGNTALHWAARFGWIGSTQGKVYALVHGGADVNAANATGWTPVMEACRSGYTEKVELLLAEDADPNATNDQGWTPLMIAVGANQPRVWRKWMDYDAEWLKRTEGFTIEDLRYLYPPSDYDEDDMSPYGTAGIVWALLLHGAKRDVTAEDGTTLRALLESPDEFHDVRLAPIRKLLEVDATKLVEQYDRAERRQLRAEREQRARQKARDGNTEPDLERPGAG